MKSVTYEDADKIVYQFTFEDKSAEFVYFKNGFIFHKNQEVAFDAIAENDLHNWIKSVK